MSLTVALTGSFMIEAISYFKSAGGLRSKGTRYCSLLKVELLFCDEQ